MPFIWHTVLLGQFFSYFEKKYTPLWMKVVSYVSYELWYIYYTSVYQIPTEPGQIYFVSAW